jgi:hypothetical protein
MDIEIDNFIKQNAVKQGSKQKKYRKGSKIKKSTKNKIQKDEICEIDRSGIGNIFIYDKYEPIRFTDNIMKFHDGKISSEIINSKQLDKYIVSVSKTGSVYITLPPKKISMTYNEYLLNNK